MDSSLISLTKGASLLASTHLTKMAAAVVLHWICTQSENDGWTYSPLGEPTNRGSTSTAGFRSRLGLFVRDPILDKEQYECHPRTGPILGRYPVHRHCSGFRSSRRTYR